MAPLAHRGNGIGVERSCDLATLFYDTLYIQTLAILNYEIEDMEKSSNNEYDRVPRVSCES